MDEDLQKWYDNGYSLKFGGSHHYDYVDGHAMMVKAIVEQERRNFSEAINSFKYETKSSIQKILLLTSK